MNECSVGKQRRFKGIDERTESLRETGAPEAEKGKCYLIRHLTDRQNILIGWETRGELREQKLVGSLKQVLICVNDLEVLDDITVARLVLKDMRAKWGLSLI